MRVLTGQVQQDAPTLVGNVAEEEHEAEPAHQDEYEEAQRRGEAAAEEAHRGQVDDRGEGQAEEAAGQYQRGGQPDSKRDEAGREEVDQERVCKRVARVDRVLRWEVAAVGEGTGVGQVRRPVAPNARVAREQPATAIAPGLREEPEG